MNPVVVVGSTGFLGSRLIDHLRGHTQVTGVARQADSPRVDVVADLRNDADLDRVQARCEDAVVFYCAAVGGRRAAAGAPEDAHRINCEVPARLAAVARQLVHFSTDYVFSQPGTYGPDAVPSPDSVYAYSKAEGERRVLSAAAGSLVVRTSGLYDECGVRDQAFRKGAVIAAADNWVTSPTHVPDLVRAVLAMVERGESGIRHILGPIPLSQYEFYQLASVRWELQVTPTLADQARGDVVLAADPHTPISHPAEVFARPTQSSRTVRVFDCVGALLSARTWRHPDPAFWAELEQPPDQWQRLHQPQEIAELYGPNPALWSRICRAPGVTLLANNGPAESFEHWIRKFRLDRYFHISINSERDRAPKPGAAFAALVTATARGREVTVFDDRPEIIDGIEPYGWTGVLTERTDTWPLASYQCDSSELP